jgi:hypothetical protein
MPHPTEHLDWLPEGKQGAICFTIDDIHPGDSSCGLLDRGPLGRIHWLLDRHPQLWVTLFVTADWREMSPTPTRTFLARIPYLRDRIYLAKLLPAGALRLTHHPHFVEYLTGMPRIEAAYHALHHVHRGPHIPLEFEDEDQAQCERILKQMIAEFQEAGLECAAGMNPPGWELPPSLENAMAAAGLRFVSSARDIRSRVTPDATTNMSGLKHVSLIYPQVLRRSSLLHFTSNFQATTSIDRAIAIVENRGLVAVKAHAIKMAFGHIALDGVDELYCNYLDSVFSTLEQRYGESLWWTSMGRIEKRLRERVVVSQHAP